MDIDKVLSDAADQVVASLSGEPVPGLGRRRRSGWVGGSLVAAAAVIVVGSVVLFSGSDDAAPLVDPTTTSVAFEPPVTSTTAPPDPELAVWFASHPPTWHRVDNDLVNPETREPFDSMTLATFPIRIGDTTCPHIPTLALMDLGPTDALVSVIFTRLSPEDAARWPDEGFGAQDFGTISDPVEAQTCSDRPDLEVHRGPMSGMGPEVTVAFGEDVTDEIRAQTWDVVSSLRPQAGAERAVGGTCVVTEPPLPGLTPPSPWIATPPDGTSVWFGTPDLWTPLPVNGVYGPRKSVWWSQNFTDWSAEPRPEIGVVYERLDERADLILSGPPGTNAFTPQDGLFMIAGIDPPTPGCWRVTSSYKGSTLSYVYYRPGTFAPPIVTTTVPAAVPVAVPGSGPLFGEDTGETLVFDNGLSGVLALDPDRRIASETPIVGQRAGDQPYRIHRVGDHLVVGWGVIYAHSLATGESTELSTGTLFVPATEPDRVWIIDWANGSRIGTGVPSAWQVDMEGNVLTEPTKIEIDGWSFPAIGVPGGLAIQTDEGVVLWYPATGVSEQKFGDSGAVVVDTWGDLMAYCTTGGCTQIAVVDLSNAAEVFIAVGLWGSRAGQFSEDGAMLALATGSGDVLVVELTNPDRVAGATKGLGDGDPSLFVSWAPDGSALYSATYSYARTSLTIVRYDVETQTSATTVLPFGGTLDFIVMTAADAEPFFVDSFSF